MSPQARFSLPPALGGLTTAEMQRVIRQANVGAENEKIAQLYFVERQIDKAEGVKRYQSMFRRTQ